MTSGRRVESESSAVRRDNARVFGCVYRAKSDDVRNTFRDVQVRRLAWQACGDQDGAQGDRDKLDLENKADIASECIRLKERNLSYLRAALSRKLYKDQEKALLRVNCSATMAEWHRNELDTFDKSEVQATNILISSGTTLVLIYFNRSWDSNGQQMTWNSS